MLNKSFITLAALSTFIWAAELDVSQAKTMWTGYKFYDKTPVSGTFSDIKYTWGKDTKSIQAALTGAKAVIKGNSVDLSDDVKNKNVSEGFFKKFKNPDIIVVINKVVPDAKDNNKGRLEASVEMNGVAKPVPVWLPYMVADGKFVAKGHVDFYDFSLGAALASLNEACGPLHEGKTWAEAGVTLEIPLKK